MEDGADLVGLLVAEDHAEKGTAAVPAGHRAGDELSRAVIVVDRGGGAGRVELKQDLVDTAVEDRDRRDAEREAEDEDREAEIEKFHLEASRRER